MQYDDKNRGVIQHRARSRQINDFKNLRFGKITPTDIDGFLDFGNKAFIYLEVKYSDAKIPYGQELALTRLCDSADNDGKYSMVLIARHEQHNTEHDIDVGNLIVNKVYYKQAWTNVFEEVTVSDAIRRFLDIRGIKW